LVSNDREFTIKINAPYKVKTNYPLCGVSGLDYNMKNVSMVIQILEHKTGIDLTVSSTLKKPSIAIF